MNIMVCGSARVEDYQSQFVPVIEGFGCESQFFTFGNIYHTPGGNPDEKLASEDAVAHADICVFVITRTIGSITWDAELPAAKTYGVPIIIMAEKAAMTVYKIHDCVELEQIPNDELRAVCKVLRDVIENYGIMPIPFDNKSFEEKLRSEINRIFYIAVQHYRERNLRLRALLNTEISETNRLLIQRVSLDPFEDKQYRKQAVRKLSQVGITADNIYVLLESDEQGVSRLTAELLPELLHGMKPPDGFFEKCIAIGNDQDDQGLIRRLIINLFKLDAVQALDACQGLDFGEVGIRRRVGLKLVEHADYLVAHGRKDQLHDLLKICAKPAKEQAWQKACGDMLKELEKEEPVCESV